MSIDIGNHKVSCIKSIDEISSKVQLRNCKFQRMKLMTSRFWLSLITGRDFATEEHKINILFNIFSIFIKNSSFIISNRYPL